MYKIETHLHTKYISQCGQLSAEEILSIYAELGYAGICVTDHYNRTCMKYAGIDMDSSDSKIEEFLTSFRKLNEKAHKYNIKIYQGAEVRLDGSNNDFLLYGFQKELLAHPGRLISGGLESFSLSCREQGALLVQAHPFRKGCNPVSPELIDGVEVYNGNRRHNSHNELAREYALTNKLLMLSGSDCHEIGDQGIGGLTCDILPENGFELANLIRQGRYSLIIN